MILKNTFKIMFSNFGLIVKACIYKLFILALTLLIGYSVLIPVVEQCAELGVFSILHTLVVDGLLVFNADVVAISLNDLNDSLIVLMQNNVTFTWNFIAVILLLTVFLPIMLGISKVAECDVLFASLSSNSQYGYMTSYFTNFKNAFAFRSFKLIFSVPLVIICVLIILLLSAIFTSGEGIIVSFLVGVLLIIALCSLFMTIFAIYEPNIAIKETNAWKALKNSVQSVKKYGFFKLYAIVFLLAFVSFVLNFIVGILTYGFGLLLTIPITLQFSSVLRMVLCFECLGMDYYISKNEVCVTKKSCDKISFESMKDLM